ncbi:MAG: lytic transglycosylase domain-containing protein [Anaerolineales bacterium]|nr:lytic transglycosylase domain-containing protein [Anaerolineales bacterium]
MMRTRILLAGLLLVMGMGTVFANSTHAAQAQASAGPAAEAAAGVLSPYWGAHIRRWSNEIGAVSAIYGLHPDLIAAVVEEESNGNHEVVSFAGAVGLMGVMPAGPGLEWRPSVEELTRPLVNLNWGTAILTEIIRQSGGDVHTALAAYSGGWELAGSRIPRQYASSVLDHYARAVALRAGVSPTIASQWTLAIEMRRGHVTPDPLLILGDQPLSGLQTYSEHVLYDFVDERGRVYAIRAYIVPVVLVVPPAAADGSGRDNTLEVQLRARMGEAVVKLDTSNPDVLMACLPSLSRLRGRASTRWFAPSSCPSWHR